VKQTYQKLNFEERAYKANFIAAHRLPYAVQRIGREWQTVHKSTNDKLIKAHLKQKIALGLPAAWYPVFCSLDIDNPTKQTVEKIYNRFERFGIGKSQILAMTTPSYEQAGNHRIYLRLEYKDKTPTHKLSHEVLQNCFGDLCEIYPQTNRKDRLPCGFGADVIKDNVRMTWLSWQEEMALMMKIDATAIESLPRQLPLFEQPSDERDNPRNWTMRGKAREIYENGLQAQGTRHEAQFILLLDFWRQNYFEEAAASFVKSWIRQKHNGFSKAARTQNWRETDKEIDRQAAYIWAMPKTLPDSTHNLHGEVTKDDLIFGAKLFPKDAVRQKQFFKLSSFCRARRHHDWIFISRRIWANEIAHETTAKSFENELKDRGIMRSINHYKTGEFSRRYQLNLPKTNEQPLIRDERNIDDYSEALRVAFDNNRQQIAQLTQLNPRTIFNFLKAEKSEKTNFI
jgi:hypothetical protein